MVNSILFILVLISCLGCFFLLYSVLKVTKHSAHGQAKEQKKASQFLPPVSILKPLCGIDPGLKANLSSFCQLDYPNYELIFCLEEEDPALNIVRELKKEYPDILIKIATDDNHCGLNPKVNNLLRGLSKSSYDLVLISDADVCADKNYLQNTTSYFQNPSVGMVTNPICGKGKGSLGAVFENLHLNFFVLGGTCFLYHFFGRTCVTGKSLLFVKGELEKIGGLSSVKDFLAEDYILGRKFERLGKKVILSNHLITSNNSERPLSKFLNRSLRWSQMRMKLGGLGYVLELLANPVFLAALLLILSSFSTFSFRTFLGISFLKIVVESIQGKKIHAQAGFSSYLLTPLKDLLIGLIWFLPFFKTSFEWRGKKLRLKPNTQLEPL